MSLHRAMPILLTTLLTGCTMSDKEAKKPAPAPTQKAQAKPAPIDLPEVGYVPSNPDSQPSVEEHLEVSFTSTGKFKKDGPVEVTFKLANSGSEPIRACKVFTPLEDLKRMSLEVTDDQGTSRRRSGSKQAGPKPGQGDWVTIEPGKSLEALVDLRNEFDLPPGSYKVRFVGHPYVNHIKDSAPHSFVVEE